MAKSKRTNYLIDKPFQLGFIFKFLLIILLSIAAVFLITILYYWVISSTGEFKLNTAVNYSKRDFIKYQGRQIYLYDKEKIELYEDKDSSGNKVFKCYNPFDSDKFKKDDMVENIDPKDITPKIGRVIKNTTIFHIIIYPLLFTCAILIIIISVYSLFFSHRMAGPVYRLRVSLDRMLKGDFDFKIQVRKHDFFQNIADKLEELRQHIVKKK